MRLVLFWELTPEGLGAVPEGWSVACIEGDGDAIAESGATRVGDRGFPDEGGSVEHTVLLELTRQLVEELRRSTPLYAWLVRLYDSSDLDHAFARAIVHDLDWLVATAAVVARDFPEAEAVRTTAEWPGSWSRPYVLRLLRAPALAVRARELLGDARADALDALEMEAPPTRLAGRPLLEAVARLAQLALAVLRRASLREPSLGQPRVTLRTYASDWEDVDPGHGRLRRVDFVVDGSELRREDVLVWAEPGVDAERCGRLRDRGYRVAGVEDVRFGPRTLLRVALPALAGLARHTRALAAADAWWLPFTSLFVRSRIEWEAAARALGPTTLLAYNDFGIESVLRNVVLHRHGARTVYYQHSSGSYSEVDGEYRESFYCAHLVFTAFAGWGPMHLDLYRRSGNAIEQYWDVGCLWSEIARRVRDDEALRRGYVEQVEPHLAAPLASFAHVVTVADSSITSDIARASWLATFETVLVAAERMPDTLFLVKPKLAVEHARDAEIAALHARMDARRNVAVIPAEYETSALVALSSAVVGMPFTSVVVEAIGLRIPAFFLDALPLFPQVSWRGVPGMVVDDAGGLVARLREVLAQSPEETLAWMRAHVAHAEGHFDGLAVTRMRQRMLEL